MGGSIETGDHDTLATTKVDAKVTSFGANVGLLVWL
jgi:hypothetical protein